MYFTLVKNKKHILQNLKHVQNNSIIDNSALKFCNNSSLVERKTYKVYI